MFRAGIPVVTDKMAEKVGSLVSAAAHYPPSDAPLFIYSYNVLVETLENKEARVLEVCCGYGKLVHSLAERFPRSHFLGIDQSILDRNLAPLSNLSFREGDATSMPDLPDGQYDLIIGQATMHHLANNLGAARKEYLRLLKPGGKCIFIFEPLGHNWLVASVRAIRTARLEMVDESNLFFSILKSFGEGFALTEVGCFNLIGYFAKILKIRRTGFYLRLNGWDRALASTFPGLVKHCANVSVCFTK